MLRRLLPTATAFLTVATLAACGSAESDSQTTGPSPTDALVDADRPPVIATTSIWADVVGNVACDDLAAVETLIPPGGDPHAFEASLRDRESMENADLVVANGLGLEEGLTDMIDAVESGGVAVIRIGDHVETLPAGDDEEADHDDEAHDADEEQDHGAEDPHVWFDPTRVIATLPAIADALADAGLDPVALDACVASYTTELAALDADIEALLSALPPERRLLVTNHDSLSYFADRYGFEILGSVIPSPSSLAGTNPGDLEDLANLIEETGVPAIFAETQHSSSDTQALADRVGDVRVVTLQTDTLGEPGSETDTYVTWLNTTAQQIAEALA